MIVVGGWPGRKVIGGNGRFGVLPSEIGNGGDFYSPLFNDIQAGDSTKEFVMVAKSLPSSGTVVLDDFGGFEHTGAVDGSYQTVVTLYTWAAGGPVTKYSPDETITTIFGSASPIPVQKTALVGYNIRTAVSAAISELYSVRLSVAATASEQYYIRTSTLASASVVYAVLTSTQVSKTYSASYFVRTSIPASSSLSYSIRQVASNSVMASYVVRVQTASGVVQEFKVRTASANSVSGSYKVRTAVVNGKAINYAILGTVPVQVSMQCLYQIFGEIVARDSVVVFLSPVEVVEILLPKP